MTDGDGLTLTLSDGDDALTWDLAILTDAPEGRFLFLDSDGDPRLILDGDELAEFQRSIAGGGRA